MPSARIEATVGARTIYRQRKGGGSMMASNDPRVTIGLGDATVIDQLIVRWPSGEVTTLKGVKVDQEHTIVEPKPSEKKGG